MRPIILIDQTYKPFVRLLLNSLSIVFDICFFYALIPLIWGIAVVLTGQASCSTFEAFALTMIVYRLLMPQHKILIVLGIVLTLTIGIVFGYLFMEMNKVSDAIQGAIVVALASAILALLSYGLIKIIDSKERKRNQLISQ